jgi:hypothetical protein
MTTTQTGLAVAGEITTESLTQRLLAPSKSLPRASRNKYVNQLSRSIGCGKATPVAHIITIVDDAIARGCSAEDVARFGDDFKTYVFARAKALQPVHSRTLGQLLLDEARAEGLKNIAEVALHNDPANPVLRERYLAAAARYREADAALTSAVQQLVAPVEAAYPQSVRASYPSAAARLIRREAPGV